MKFYYDTKPVYPYVCIADIKENELQKFIGYIKEKGIIVTKFYEEPTYPASDGIKYDYLLRISHKNLKNNIKPHFNEITKLFSNFKEVNLSNQNNFKRNQLLESEKKHFKQVRTFLDSERKIIELDRQFFKEQVENLTNITKNLKTENSKIFKFIENYNDKVNNEIQSIIDNKSFNNEEVKLLKNKLSQKEENISKKESDLRKKENELEKTKKDNEEYRENLNKEYKNLVQQLREVSLGVEAQEEDTIQDLKILVFGNTKINSTEIYEIFNELFFNTFGENLDKKCVEAKLLDYKSIKNSNINKKIKRDKYDYIIVGQHDHSTKGKNSKHSYQTFINNNNLKALVSEDYDNPLNKEKITELGISIIRNWEEKFEIIE